MAGSGVSRVHALAIGAVLIVCACGQAAPLATPSPGQPTDQPAGQPTSSGAAQPTPSGAPDAGPLVDFATTTDPGAAAAREQELTNQLRDDTGFAPLIGASGTAALTDLDAITNTFAQQLIADVAAAIDAGTIPGASGTAPGRLAAVGDWIAAGNRSPSEIDTSVFANTGFTTSALMGLYAGLVRLAGESASGTLPRQETVQQTSGGLNHKVDLGTTLTVTTGGGHVSMDVVMTATDSITDAASGSFVALYTSRTTAHFDVNACPDDSGVADGTYTFETKHELNDVSSPTASRSGAGRSADAPFRLIDGPDAHLVRIEAALDMTADGHGPGSAGGPGPTEPFDWGANQHVDLVMPAGGGTTASGVTRNVSGSGGERSASGAMFLSSAMAQLFLAELAKEAEKFWRSGECIEIKTSEEGRDVTPDETVDFEATAVGKFDGADIDAPIKGTFNGEKSLDPDGQAQDPPASFTFTAGSDKDDKGTIQLEQTGVRGIGKKTLEFKVGVSDYRIDEVPLGGFDGWVSGLKCDGLAGAWTLNYGGQISGMSTFTLPEGGAAAPAHTDLFIASPNTHYSLNGTASVVDTDEHTTMTFVLGTGTVKITVPDATVTQPFSMGAPLTLQLEKGDFCGDS